MRQPEFKIAEKIQDDDSARAMVINPPGKRSNKKGRIVFQGNQPKSLQAELMINISHDV